MGDNIPSTNGRSMTPLMAPEVIDKFLEQPLDDIKIQIVKAESEDGKNYAEFQAIIVRPSHTIGLRTPIPEKKDYMPALSMTLMSILQEIEKKV